MAKKNKKIDKFLENELKNEKKMIAINLANASKVLLSSIGFELNFKVNGCEINSIDEIHNLQFNELLEKAIKEERYEDAQKIKNVLENIPSALSEYNSELSKKDVRVIFDGDDVKITQSIIDKSEDDKFEIFEPSSDDEKAINFVENVRGRIIPERFFLNSEKILKKVFKISRKKYNEKYDILDVNLEGVSQFIFLIRE
jgi:hypothetical protein